MGGLRTLKPRVATLDPRRIKPATVAETQRLSSKSGGAWAAIRKRILTRDCGICQCAECKRLGRLRPAQEVDHRIPLWEGGTDDEANLQSINRECHVLKTAEEAKRRG